ncbi:MAG: hypothetical protein R2849_09775 [Thermomicrobiales bacterium]
MPFEDLTGIEIDAARLDLVIESDPDLIDAAQLLAESGIDAPTLSMRGTRLVLNHDGRYRGTTAPVLKLPASDLPTIAANIARGNLTVDNISATLALNISSGNLRISGGEGDAAVNVSSGNATIRQREGNIACHLDSGNLGLAGCRGDFGLNISKGNADLLDCGGEVRLRVDKGNVTAIRPIEQQLQVSVSKGNVRVQGGSLESADIDVARGNVNSSARLLFTEPAEPTDEPDDLGGFEEAIDDVVNALDEEVRFNLGSVQFIASEAGVRLSTGGTERFVAGPDGVEFRRSDGTPIFSASERGVNVGTSRRGGNEHFRFKTARGNISIEVPEDQPARVELILNRGSVQSDIPLVEVGRPGPRSSTRRYVGVSDSSDADRILIRALTQRGDIQVRQASAAREQAQPGGTSTRERQRRQILEALAQGRITADEADILLAAMERESG